MKASPISPGEKDITWPNQVAVQGRKASGTQKPQTSNVKPECLLITVPVTMS